MSNLQDIMFTQMKDKSLFDQAQRHAFDYLETVFDRQVKPTGQALDRLMELDESMPESIGSGSEILQKLHEVGSPNTIPQIAGRYFGFVNGGVVPTGLAAKNLSIFWDQNSAMQVLSPISSKLESVVQRWLIELFGLPDHTVAGFVSGTSMANFCALAAARYRLLQNQGWNLPEQGLFDAPKLRVVTGRDAHSTVLKAISLVGLGKANIEWVEVDDQGRIIPESIPELDNRTLLILQAGNVNSGSFDPLDRICQKAREQGAWIHIDGAFGLWAGATERFKHLTKDMQYAHSWAVDAHKTLNTPYDSGLVICADEEALTSALHMTGGYIVVGEDRDGMFYTPEMSRRARIIELWATLKFLGRSGIDELIYGLHERARQFAAELEKADGYTVLNEVVFNQVLVGCESDEITERVIARIQDLRACWVGGSTWKGHEVIRISVCSWATTRADVSLSVRSFVEAMELVKSQD